MTRYLLDGGITLVCTLAGILLLRWLPAWRRLTGVALALCLVQNLLAVPAVANVFNHVLVHWTRCAGLLCGIALLYGAAVYLLFRSTGTFDPSRRKLLNAGVTAAVAAPVAFGSVAYIRREDLRFREVNVRIRNLPKDLDGLRIAQLTDIHLGPFLEERTLLRAIGMTNETKPHLTFVTGDLISTQGDPLDKCIEHLASLRADAGLWGCLGNHERYAKVEDYTDRETRRIGLQMLRHESAMLHFGDAALNLVGVDYQRKGTPYLTGVESLIVPGAYNVLLSHSPDVFGVSSKQGFDLTIAGHTHGGQVTFEMVHPSLNIARFYTPWVHGLYEREGKSMYVSRGIGTIGVPARFGAPPEVVLLRLCAI